MKEQLNYPHKKTAEKTSLCQMSMACNRALLKTLSWNIHDNFDRCEGPKTDDAYVNKILRERNTQPEKYMNRPPMYQLIIGNKVIPPSTYCTAEHPLLLETILRESTIINSDTDSQPNSFPFPEEGVRQWTKMDSML